VRERSCPLVRPWRLWPEVASWFWCLLSFFNFHLIIHSFSNHWLAVLIAIFTLTMSLPPPPANSDSADTSAPSLVRTYRVWQGSNVSNTQLIRSLIWFIFRSSFTSPSSIPSSLCQSTPSWFGSMRIRKRVYWNIFNSVLFLHNWSFLFCKIVLVLLLLFVMIFCFLKSWFQFSQVFLFGGRLIFGPDVKSIFISIFLVIVPIAVFCALVARKLLDDFPHHSGWSIMGVVIALTLFVSYFLFRISYITPLIDEAIVY